MTSVRCHPVVTPCLDRFAKRLFHRRTTTNAGGQNTELLRPVPGIDGRDVPSLDLSALKNEAQRVRERGIEAPLPRSLYGGDDADPTISSAA